MKLLFENWRKYLNENLSKKEIEQAISDASFNSAQSSQHRWGRGQPIIDYTDTPDGRRYTATYPDGTENSDLWPSRESKPGEDLETFLKRVEEPIQLNLVENWRKYVKESELKAIKEGVADYIPGTSAHKMKKAIQELNPEQESVLKKALTNFNTCPTKEELKKSLIKLAGLTAFAPGGLLFGTMPLLYKIAQRVKCYGVTEDLYYGTSTVFQEEISENGIKSPSKWGNYGFAEENAMKIVEKHGGEPAVIQIPLSEFKDEHFLLDESDNATIIYTEDFHIFMEKQEKKLV